MNLNFLGIVYSKKLFVCLQRFWWRGSCIMTYWLKGVSAGIMRLNLLFLSVVLVLFLCACFPALGITPGSNPILLDMLTQTSGSSDGWYPSAGPSRSAKYFSRAGKLKSPKSKILSTTPSYSASSRAASAAIFFSSRILAASSTGAHVFLRPEYVIWMVAAVNTNPEGRARNEATSGGRWK